MRPRVRVSGYATCPGKKATARSEGQETRDRQGIRHSQKPTRGKASSTVNGTGARGPGGAKEGTGDALSDVSGLTDGCAWAHSAGPCFGIPCHGSRPHIHDVKMGTLAPACPRGESAWTSHASESGGGGSPSDRYKAIGEQRLRPAAGEHADLTDDLVRTGPQDLMTGPRIRQGSPGVAYWSVWRFSAPSRGWPRKSGRTIGRS